MPKSKVPKLRCAVGIDGCRAGWISVIRKFDGSLAWQLAPSTTEILSSLPKDAVVLIDMIIGLPKGEQSGRQCDRLARQILQPHGSRVFAAPPREALRAHSYKEACRLARQASGKAISKQCWYLFPKIKELDLLRDQRIRESHPELVFSRFNQGRPIATSKKQPAGQLERLKLLQVQMPESHALYNDLIAKTRRKDIARDDALDALALCAVATQPDKLTRLPKTKNVPAIWF